MPDADLAVIVPSRGRPHTVAEMARAFRDTCTAGAQLVFAVDEDDPEYQAYRKAVYDTLVEHGRVHMVAQPAGTMVSALNHAARVLLDSPAYVRPQAIGFMGDDHRPRTKGWDTSYLQALQGRPGIVYGNDLIQGASLPTQCAISASVVRALGFMAPPVLTHLYVDNYWLQLGRATGCISYLPQVIVEHVHPVGGKAEWDDGYRRVNAPTMYQRDKQAFLDYVNASLSREIQAVLTVRMARAAVTS
jgi:hypothetical protein